MSSSILVTYATRYGSTQEVAETIAGTLRDAGLDVDIQPARDVRALESYDAVVLGAPLYVGRWHEQAHSFLSKFHEALLRRSVAIFALGPLSTDEAEMLGTRRQLDNELGKYPWLKPVALELFVGKYDPAKLSFSHKLLTIAPASPLHGKPASDNRNWTAIRAWASELAADFQLALPKEQP
jgi:menaquinone-dependent protoporphyrinogen oxidase